MQLYRNDGIGWANFAANTTLLAALSVLLMAAPLAFIGSIQLENAGISPTVPLAITGGLVALPLLWVTFRSLVVQVKADGAGFHFGNELWTWEEIDSFTTEEIRTSDKHRRTVVVVTRKGGTKMAFQCFTPAGTITKQLQFRISAYRDRGTKADVPTNIEALSTGEARSRQAQGRRRSKEG